MSYKLTQAQFIKRAQAAHGNKYDYSQAVYSSMKAKVAIICPVHGLFEQAPNQHLAGAECTRCGHKGRPLSQESFLTKAYQAHGERYDYSNSIYRNAKTKVKILCHVHGLFEQTPDAHLRGRGCSACGHNIAALSSQEFIEKARHIHGNIFDYTWTIYINSSTKVTIICPAHGSFQQLPQSHLKMNGCAKCSRIKRALGQGNFVDKSRQVHGNRYDYSQVKYFNNEDKVAICCPTHGEFMQRPSNHMQGQGCPACTLEVSGNSWKAANWVAIQAGRIAKLYIARLKGEGELFYKAGITLNSFKRRYKGRQFPYHIEKVAVFGSSNALIIHKLEQAIKTDFKELQYKPRHFFAGRTECYVSADQILEFLALQTHISKLE